MKKNYEKIAMCFFLLAFTFAVSGQSELRASKYGDIIASYLNSSENASKVSGSDLADIYVNREFSSKKTGIANVYLNQRYKGIKIFNAITSVGIKDNKVFHFADNFKSGLSTKVNAISESLTPVQAINKVAQYFKLGTVSGIEVLEEGNNMFKFSKGNISQEDISVEKVYFVDKDGTLKLSWNLNIYTLDGMHWWSARVDALTGKILDINDWGLNCNFGDVPHNVHNHSKRLNKDTYNLFEVNSSVLVDGSTYNVFALPTESPNHGSRQLVIEPANLNASPFGWHDVNGVAGADLTDTRGNNVVAQDDADNNNAGGSRPSGGSALNFDFPLDLNDQPEVSQDASITNLFYMNNMIHDIFYEYGFDEASGNFQQTNYSGATGGGDFVYADGLDGGGLNNANFFTPTDGSRPRMQMYLWNTLTSNALTINNGALSGDYVGSEAGFGGDLTSTPLTNDLGLLIDDDSGVSTDPNDACDVIMNPLSLAGKIAVLRRGECEFGTKVLAAENAGAVAVIVVNNVSPGIIYMGPGDDGDSVTIPAIMVSQSDGEAIIAALINGDTISASLVKPAYIDGNYDNGVIGHEYGHGISTRLTGGADNSDCLIACTERDTEGNCIGTFTEQMGEGWSDWVTLVTTMKSGDLAIDARGIGTFDSDQDTNGPGIRVYQYSTDTAINPTSYANTNDTATFSAPHGVGEIWAAMLWDLTWAYVDKYGFDPDLYNGIGGNNKAMQIVLDGMKLQPCNPGFVDGRDAILAADTALTGGEDQCMIWEVFAARGLGVNANQGSSLSRTDQTGNSEMPDPSDSSLANCTTLSATDFKSSDYRIYPNPASSLVTIKSNRDLGDVTLKLVDINGREVLTKRTSLMGEVDLDVSGLQSGLYILNIKGDYINTNEKIVIK